jgi:LytS/YehU family sensor histidine kinase
MEKSNGIIFRHRVLWHVLFWIVWYLFYAITYGSNNDQYANQFVFNLYLLPIRMAGTYIFIYVILPKFLFTKKYLGFSILTLVHAILFGVVIWFVFEHFIFVHNNQSHNDNYPTIYLFKIFGTLILNYQIPAIAAGLVIFKRWYLIQQRTLVLEKENLAAELKFLKNQIHPHFLFNTLNNLYALTLQKSDKAPDIVIMLSNQLDYILYSSNESEVKLEHEINQMKGYIELEKIRYGDRLTIDYQVNGEIDGKYIAPLILLPFLENSFKHGASRDAKTPFIKIELLVTGIQLEFMIENSYEPDLPKAETHAEGIGLTNVKRRLDLLYPQQYSLDISKDNGIFKVLLSLRLTEKHPG